MNIKEIYVNPNNPRYIKDDRYQKLKKSIQEFPKMMKLRPIIIDDNGMILGGNMRYLAMKDLGYIDIPGGWIVKASELTEEEKKRFIIADNVEFGVFDYSILANEWELEELQEWGIELPEIEIKAEEDDFDVDKAIEAIKEPICKRGDIWQLGEHRLMCGDATVEEDVKKLMDGKKADMVFTDPPYNIDIKYASYRDKDLDYWNKVNIWMDLINRYSEKDFSIYVKQYTFNTLNTILSFEKIKYNIRNIIIWKAMSMAHPDNNYDNSYEIIIYGIKGQPTFNTWAEKREKPENYWSGRGIEFKGKISNIWDDITPIYAGCIQMSDMKNIENKKQHPTEMPIKLPTRAINFSSIENNIILDLFGGSGSTLIACEQLNRKCYMMEIDPIYCDVIIKRWEGYTNMKAVLIK